MVELDRTGQSRISGRILRYHGALSCLGHILLFAVAFFCAFGLYYNFGKFDRWFKPFYITLLPLVVISQVTSPAAQSRSSAPTTHREVVRNKLYSFKP